MKISTIGVLSIVGVAISTPLWAGPVGVQRSLTSEQQEQQAIAISELQAKKEQVSRAVRMPPDNRGMSLIHNMDRMSELNDMINRLQTGQPVSPDEIDQQLETP
jgi:hypothetical protein